MGQRGEVGVGVEEEEGRGEVMIVVFWAGLVLPNTPWERTRVGNRTRWDRTPTVMVSTVRVREVMA